MSNPTYIPNKKLDLTLERVIDVEVEKVWQAWTIPVQLMQWFTPVPWKTVECEIDLRPGGKFYTVMCSPEGEKFPGTGCYLEVVENKKLTWTDALETGFRPAKTPNECINSFFTATLLLERVTGGTKYTAIAQHSNPEAKKAHQDKGFEEGWGTALDQMVALIKSGHSS